MDNITLNSADWFKNLFGFDEQNYTYKEVQNKFKVMQQTLYSKENNKLYIIGEFSTPSLDELRKIPIEYDRYGILKFGTVRTNDVSILQSDPINNGALFQVASQFNCLEFNSYSCEPEKGITNYVYDKTQGPACSVSTGPATLYRNYYTNVNGQTGQTKNNQINNLKDVLEYLDNPFEVKNGYTIPTNEEFKKLEKVLSNVSDDSIKKRLRIGLHKDIDVTSSNWGTQICNNENNITQVFGSACSINITLCDISIERWERFASLILEASYEATILAAIHNNCKRVFLTRLGGGVFLNHPKWINNAINKLKRTFQDFDIEIYEVIFDSCCGKPVYKI